MRSSGLSSRLIPMKSKRLKMRDAWFGKVSCLFEESSFSEQWQNLPPGRWSMSSGGCGRTSWRGTDTVDSRFRHRPWLRRACFLEEFSQPFASLMQLGLRVSLEVSKNFSYLAVAGNLPREIARFGAQDSGARGLDHRALLSA